MIEHQETKGLTLPAETHGNGKPAVYPLPTAPRRRRRGWGWVWLLVLGGLGYGAFRYYQNAEQVKAAKDAAQAARLANRSESVAAAVVRTGDMPVYLRGLGTVTAYNTDNIKTRVDGPIVVVDFKEGQHVEQGQLLVEIDPRTYQAALDQAEGQLARDQAQLNDAKVNLARYEALWDAGVIAKQQLDTQGAQVGQFEGTIEADKAAIDNAKLNLQLHEDHRSHHRTHRPAPGGCRQYRPRHRSDAYGRDHPDAADRGALHHSRRQSAAGAGQAARRSEPAGRRLRPRRPGQNRHRHRSTVDNQIDPTTGTSRLKAVFSNENEVLFPKQFVNCRLLLDIKHGVVIVPAAAIQRGPQGAYVWIVGSDGTATMRTVTLGITEGGNAADHQRSGAGRPGRNRRAGQTAGRQQGRPSGPRRRQPRRQAPNA